MSSLSEKIHEGVSWIFQHQTSHGFIHTGEFEEMYSPFFTAMILLCLRELYNKFPETSQIIENGMKYLESQRSSEYTCNYHNSAPETPSPYPDDLDDTFLYLLCKKYFCPQSINEQVFIKILSLLVRNEVAPGGPYFTWDVPHNQRESWDNVDPIVNSTLHYYLIQENIHLPVLQKYLDTCVYEKNYTSDFYHSPLITLYFLTRTHLTHHPEKIRETIWEYFRTSSWGSITEQLCALISLLRTGEPIEKVSHLIEPLIDLDYERLDNDPFFREKVTTRETIFASCKALTVALHIELLYLYEQLQQIKHPDETLPTSPCEKQNELSCATSLESDSLASHDTTSPTISFEQVSRYCILTLENYPELQNIFCETLQHLGRGDVFEKVFLLPTLVACEIFPRETSLPHQTLLDITAGGLFGWMGYTLADMMLDREITTDRLPLVLNCILLSFSHFERARISPADDSIDIVTACLQEIHESLCFEIDHAHVSLSQGTLTCDEGYFLLLEKHNLLVDQFCAGKKSIGLFIGPLIMIEHLEISDADKKLYQKSLYEFAIRYLTVRQWGDDIHDWYEDLKMGYINPIGARVLCEYHKTFPQEKFIAIQKSYHELHAIFWHAVFDPLVTEVEKIIGAAENILTQSTLFSSTSILFELLHKERETLLRAKNDREQSLRFIEVYREMFGRENHI